jgi:peptidoglycan hydrolase-like protein with peptidoglycan-binding domain
MRAYRFVFIIVILILVSLACNLPLAAQSSTTTTETPTGTIMAETPSAETATETLPAATPTDTLVPTSTDTPVPTPTMTPTEIPCNQARFVSDVTIPDGTKFSPNENFKKTWRLKNTGSCTWTSGYDIVFINGDAMNAPDSVQITSASVAPGGEVNVSANMTAPDSPGTYRGNWKLRDGSNHVFGVENSDNGLFWVEIKVKAPAAVTIPDWPLVKNGDQGANVYAVQYLLRAHGSSLNADGKFGPITRNEVISFQGSKGLSVDGIVGPQTWTALISGKTVKKGSSGEAVKAAQRLLKKFGYSLNVDGIFGTKTDQAVNDFQTKYGLQVDGIVGPQTWQALVALP